MFSCIISFHVCTNVCFHLMSNVQIVRTFKNWIPTETFEKWHQKSYSCVSYVKSETCQIWRTVAWFLKPFGERVEEKTINYNLAKPSSTVKIRAVYRECNICNICYQVFLGNRKIDFTSKIWNFHINFQTYINFFPTFA